MKTKHLDRLLRSLAERREVRVDRRLDGYGRMGGFVLAISDELVLLHEIHEFQPDGCRVFRLQDISGARSGRFERASEQVIEGIDALGRWKKKPRRIRIEHITCVQLESPYAEAWIRHIGPCPALAALPPSAVRISPPLVVDRQSGERS